MELGEVRRAAETLVTMMSKYCERVEIGGSIRRGKPQVKDMEIVCVPKWEIAPIEEQVRDLFGSPPKTPANFNLLHYWAVCEQKILTWIKPGTQEIIPWQVKPEGKYWRGVFTGAAMESFKLDLFLARPENFGIIHLIRTGAAEFSAAVLGHAKHNTPYQTESSYYEEHEMKGKPEGYLVRKATGERVETREEHDVFELLGLEYLAPAERIDGRSLRPLARRVSES
jgi:DNA polymerase/3'-5' exonuclease PolX